MTWLQWLGLVALLLLYAFAYLYFTRAPGVTTKDYDDPWP